MSYGIQVFSSSGGTIFDTESATIGNSYQMAGSATLNTSGGVFTNAGYIWHVGRQTYENLGLLNYKDGIVLVQPTTFPTACFILAGVGTNFAVYSNNATTFKCIGLKNVALIDPPSSGYGFEVYNSDNELTFSSDLLMGRGRAIISGLSSSGYSETGASLFSNAPFFYNLVTWALSPTYGIAKGLVTVWNSATSVSTASMQIAQGGTYTIQPNGEPPPDQPKRIESTNFPPTIIFDSGGVV